MAVTLLRGAEAGWSFRSCLDLIVGELDATL